MSNYDLSMVKDKNGYVSNTVFFCNFAESTIRHVLLGAAVGYVWSIGFNKPLVTSIQFFAANLFARVATEALTGALNKYCGLSERSTYLVRASLNIISNVAYGVLGFKFGLMTMPCALVLGSLHLHTTLEQLKRAGQMPKNYPELASTCA